MPSHSQLIIEGQKVSPVRDSQSRKEPGASSIEKFETALSNLKVDFLHRLYQSLSPVQDPQLRKEPMAPLLKAESLPDFFRVKYRFLWQMENEQISTCTRRASRDLRQERGRPYFDLVFTDWLQNMVVKTLPKRIADRFLDIGMRGERSCSTPANGNMKHL